MDVGVRRDAEAPQTGCRRVARNCAAARDEHGPIDVLVNNAGYGQEGVLEESSLDDLQRLEEVLLGGGAGHGYSTRPSAASMIWSHVCADWPGIGTLPPSASHAVTRPR